MTRAQQAMTIYLVGGAVRDHYLGLPVGDRDWVVVGATPAMLLAQGYQQVGRDFPVFLHPKTGEEYALARLERKTGQGHQAFAFDITPTVTLEEDLLRRDLTINAMAQDDAGNLIDPFHGQQDCDAKCLRHVSMAFSEDPLRCLRVARFAAQLPGFTVHPETLTLMQGMVAENDLATLSKPRVWQEWLKALQCQDFAAFLQVLHAMGAWRQWQLTWAERLVQLPYKNLAPINRFGLLCAQLSAEDANILLASLTPPNAFVDLVHCLHATQRLCHAWPSSWQASHYMQLFQCLDAFRRPERLTLWQEVAMVAPSFQSWHDVLADLAPVLAAATMPTAQAMIAQGHEGAAIGEALYAARQSAIAAFLEQRANAGHG